MDFDPPISSWTNEQLEESLEGFLDHERHFLEAFGDDPVFLQPIRNAIESINTELLERILLKS